MPSRRIKGKDVVKFEGSGEQREAEAHNRRWAASG